MSTIKSEVLTREQYEAFRAMPEREFNRELERRQQHGTDVEYQAAIVFRGFDTWADQIKRSKAKQVVK